MKWVILGFCMFFTVRALACWLRAQRCRPSFLDDLSDYLEQIHDATALMDELADRYPQWRNDELLVHHAAVVEDIGSSTARQLMNMLFGLPLKALERLEILSYVLDESVQEFKTRAEELNAQKPSLIA